MKVAPGLFVGAVSLLAIGAIAIGLSLLDPPGIARLRKLDIHRLEDLRQIRFAVERYHKDHNVLPQSLDQLNIRSRALKDVVTEEPYGYTVDDAGTYELCAVFDTAPDEASTAPYDHFDTCPMPGWKHTRGQYCYIFTAKGCR